MAKLQAKKINEALKKAQRVGEVELPFSIMGCSVVLRSLRPEEYESALRAVDEYADLQYINAFKREHICRAICEVNGESLREYDFVEVEVEEPDRTGTLVVKKISLERHKFVSDYILSTWSREAIDTAFRKFNEVVAKSEKAAVEGVEFTIPDETPEDKYRRLLTEVKDIEGQIPFELSARILKEQGYILASSSSELKEVDQKLSQLSGEPLEPEREVVSQGQVPSQPRQENVPEPQPERTRSQLQPDPEVLMRQRRPLNQTAFSEQQPPPEMQVRPAIPATSASIRRAQEIEAIEQGAMLESVVPVAPTRLLDGIPELAEPVAKVNPKAAEQIFEQPPTAGINPRYRAPTRM